MPPCTNVLNIAERLIGTQPVGFIGTEYLTVTYQRHYVRYHKNDKKKTEKKQKLNIISAQGNDIAKY